MADPSSDAPQTFRGTERFELRRRLGRGGMGVVYEAYDRQRCDRVALKTVQRLDGDAVYLFKNEFRALADLTHPNLIKLGELIFDGQNWFFTMELVEGQDFVRYVREPSTEAPLARPDATTATQSRDPLFDEKRLRNAVTQLCLGLEALHSAKKVHRDIKPHNVLVSPTGRVVLLDFGLVTESLSNRRTEEGFILGTPSYMAPEQAGLDPVGPEADYYAVGVMLYEALTGRLPFTGTTRDVLRKKQGLAPPRPSMMADDLPEDLDDLCMDLLQVEPGSRPDGPQIRRRLQRTPEVFPELVPETVASSPVSFVGRGAELTRLAAAFAEAAHGSLVVVVRGESGVGKSSLVRHFVESLEGTARGLVVLWGRCYERESVPYRAFDGVIDALSRHLLRMDPLDAARLLPPDREAASLLRIFPVLRRVPALERVPAVPPGSAGSSGELSGVNPHELRRQAFAALREVFYRLSSGRRVVVVIDDLQWADNDSLVLIDELLGASAAPPVLLLATLRGNPPGLPARTAIVELAGLAPEEARALLTQLGVSHEVATSLAAEAQGHPMFIRELATQSTGERAVRLDDVLWERISVLDESLMRLLNVVVVAGVPMAQGTVAAAAMIDPALVSNGIDVLREARLVRTQGLTAGDKVEPYHSRISETVLAHLDDANRAILHRRLAGALEAAGVGDRHPEILVRHLELGGEPARAAGQALRAAAAADAALAFDRAAELYRTALRLGRVGTAATPPFDLEALRRLHAQLGRALANSGRTAEAAEAFLTAARGAPAAEHLRLQAEAAGEFLSGGHVERGVEVLRGVLAEIGGSWPASPRRAFVSLVAKRARLLLRGLEWQDRREEDLPARALLEADIYENVATGLGPIDTIRGAVFQAEALLRALALGERRRVIRSLAREAGFRAIAGKESEPKVWPLVEKVRLLAEPTGDPGLLAWWEFAVAVASFFTGRYRDAIQFARTAETHFREHVRGCTAELNVLRTVHLFGLLNAGELRELDRWVRDYLADARRRGDRYMESSIIRAFHLVWLLCDEGAVLLAEFDRRPWISSEGEVHHQHWYELWARGELMLYQGQADLVSLRPALNALQGSMVFRLQPTRAFALWLWGRLALSERASGTARLAEVERIARRLASEPDGNATLYAAFLDAGLAHQRGQPERARAALQRVVTVAESYDFRLYRAVAQRRLGDLVGGDAGARLIAEASAYMEVEHVAHPERLFGLFAPGFEG